MPPETARILSSVAADKGAEYTILGAAALDPVCCTRACACKELQANGRQTERCLKGSCQPDRATTGSTSEIWCRCPTGRAGPSSHTSNAYQGHLSYEGVSAPATVANATRETGEMSAEAQCRHNTNVSVSRTCSCPGCVRVPDMSVSKKINKLRASEVRPSFLVSYVQ